MMKCPKCNKSDEVVTRPDGTKHCLDCGESVASGPSDATACSASLARLLETVDDNGNLMPSFLQTPSSDEAKTAGLVEDVRTKYGPWQRLTVAGMHLKFGLPNA